MNGGGQHRQAKAGEGAPELIKALRIASVDEAKAVEFFESERWGDYPGCPRCGHEDVVQMRSRSGERNARYLWVCRGCKKQFTVRIGTIMEESRLPLKHWAYAYWRAVTSKKGVSAMEIHRHCGISYKSALFLMHRIRHALHEPRPRKLASDVEADETFVGGRPRGYNRELPKSITGRRKTYRKGNKTPVLAVVEREGGEVRCESVSRVTSNTVNRFLQRHVEQGQVLMTDENPCYITIGRSRFVYAHHTVNHKRHEYVNGPIHTNTIEGFFSLVKRSLYGIFHSVSKKHLHRYLAEFAFRYNVRHLDDGDRTALAIASGVGKRLRYDDYVARKSA